MNVKNLKYVELKLLKVKLNKYVKNVINTIEEDLILNLFKK